MLLNIYLSKKLSIILNIYLSKVHFAQFNLSDSNEEVSENQKWCIAFKLCFSLYIYLVKNIFIEKSKNINKYLFIEKLSIILYICLEKNVLKEYFYRKIEKIFIYRKMVNNSKYLFRKNVVMCKICAKKIFL